MRSRIGTDPTTKGRRARLEILIFVALLELSIAQTKNMRKIQDTSDKVQSQLSTDLRNAELSNYEKKSAAPQCSRPTAGAIPMTSGLCRVKCVALCTKILVRKEKDPPKKEKGESLDEKYLLKGKRNPRNDLAKGWNQCNLCETYK